MAREFKETARFNTDLKKLHDNWDSIDWGKKEKDMSDKYTCEECEKGFNSFTDFDHHDCPLALSVETELLNKVTRLEAQLKEALDALKPFTLFKLYEDYEFKKRRDEEYYTNPVVFKLAEFENNAREARVVLAKHA